MPWTRKPVLRGLDIGIRRGAITAIMGPSGTGIRRPC
jgi:ABC-type transporter Mla maintaining outer membrane lipid asymmetry ATPase subunit MlaF